MVEGHSLLDEPHCVPRLRQTIRSLPREGRRILFSVVEGLVRRRDRAIELTEAFCLEEHSRYTWRVLGGQQFRSNVGVPGAEGLGLNHIQQMWIAYNTLRDDRDREEHAWSCAKFTASTMAPKGIQKIDHQEMARRREEDARHQLIRDGAYYWATGKIAQRTVLAAKRRDEGVLIPLKSHEELEDEMRMWVSGDMDKHDKIVEEFKSRLISEHQRAQREQEERRRALELALREEPVRAIPLVGLTAAEVQERVGHHRFGVRPVYDQGKNERLREKIESEVGPGEIRVQGRRMVAPHVTLEGDGDTLTLQERVAMRKVPYGSRRSE